MERRHARETVRLKSRGGGVRISSPKKKFKMGERMLTSLLIYRAYKFSFLERKKIHRLLKR